MSERWRGELQECAQLLDAVANGDRMRVVKLLAAYLLADQGADSNSTSSENTGISAQDGEAHMQYNYGDNEGNHVFRPRRRVRFTDIDGNEEEDEEEEEGGDFSSDDNGDYRDNYEDQGDETGDWNDAYYGNVDPYDETVWHDPYYTGLPEEESHQYESDDGTVYDDSNHSYEGYNAYANAFNPYANDFTYQLPDSEEYFMPRSHSKGYQPQQFPAEIGGYNTDYDGYRENDPTAYYNGLYQYGSEDQDYDLENARAHHDSMDGSISPSSRSKPVSIDDINEMTLQSMPSPISSLYSRSGLSSSNTGSILGDRESAVSTEMSALDDEYNESLADVNDSRTAPENEQYPPLDEDTSDFDQINEPDNTSTVDGWPYHVDDDAFYPERDIAESGWFYEGQGHSDDLDRDLEDLMWQHQAETTSASEERSLVYHDPDSTSSLRRLVDLWKKHRSWERRDQELREQGITSQEQRPVYETVDPTYNVFNQETRFYDRYSGHTEDSSDSRGPSSTPRAAERKGRPRWLSKKKWARLMQQ